MKTLTISIHYILAMIEGAKRHGIDYKPLLGVAGIPLDILDEPKARVYPDSLAKFYTDLSEILDDEYVGLLNHPVRKGAFATLCELTIQQATVRDALLRGSRFNRLFDVDVMVHFRETQTAGELYVQVKNKDLDGEHFVKESQLVFWHRLLCWLSGQMIPMTEAHFAYPEPEHVQEYKPLFYCPHSFNASETKVLLPKDSLDQPIVKDADDLAELLKLAPGVFFSKPTNTSSTSSRIKNLLGKHFDREFPDLETVASKLHTTPQTLRRRLKDEKTSYQEIKDQVRRDIAIFHLSQNKLSINEIAARVGFTEPSTFHRAFKKWTGSTPGAYRESEIVV